MNDLRGRVPLHPEAGASLARRLWIYQSERFPLHKTAILLGVFSAASISVSAQLANRPAPDIWVFISTWMVAFIVFFQMRACDEYKDLDDDRRYRPERPIPSGLVSLRTIAVIALVGGAVAVALTIGIDLRLLFLLAFVWLWLGLMTVEFFVPVWLKARPFAYLVTHMAIMALIDLYVTGAEWIGHGKPPPGIWLFLGLSFINGCVLEIGRKVWAPENERTGVETYSALLGPSRSAHLWAGICAAAWVILAIVGWTLDAVMVVALPGLVLLLVIIFVALRFARAPDQGGQKLIDTLAGVWVLICYCLAGYGPVIAGKVFA